MQLQAMLWLFLPVLVAAGSALLAYALMHARMEVALAKERQELAETRATLQSHKTMMEERIKATEEATRRATLDEVMRDIHIEERSYIRETQTPDGNRRSMVMQERVFFRNIPMSSWTERELLIEQVGPGMKLASVEEMETAAELTEPSPVHPLPAPNATRTLHIVQAAFGFQ
jgi:hypothetical protein